jgi:hypothetical protein
VAKTSYQTYTSETPIDIYRKDFLRRNAMCVAMSSKVPALEPVAREAGEIIAAIDGRKTDLQQAEDDQVRAKALEDVERMDVVDAYSKMRLSLTIHAPDQVPRFLPDAPSSLKKIGPKKLTKRVQASIINLSVLPEDHPTRREYLPLLERELEEFTAADLAEDTVRTGLATINLGLSVYKSELSQVRDAQLGTIQSVLGDRSRAAQFTIPWHAPRKKTGESTTTSEPSETTTEETPE